MAPRVRRSLERLAVDLQRIFGARFEALVAYGHARTVGFVTSLEAEDLEACGALVDTWHRGGVHVPLLLTADEFRRSLDAFPLEFQTILDDHVVIAGQPPFAGVAVDRDDLRRACETQARGFLIHLRQGWIEAAGHRERLAANLAAAAPQLRALLQTLARLDDRREADLAAVAERLAGMPAALVRDLLALEHAPDRAPDLVPRLGEVLAASERLWQVVDAWR